MAKTQATLGYGTVLQFETSAGSGMYDTIEELQDLPDFGEDAGTVPATHQQSPGGRMEYIAALVDGQDLTPTFHYIASITQEAVRAAAQQRRSFRIVWSAAGDAMQVLTQTFDALILGTRISGPVQEKKILSLHLKVTGAIEEEETT